MRRNRAAATEHARAATDDFPDTDFPEALASPAFPVEAQFASPEMAPRVAAPIDGDDIPVLTDVATHDPAAESASPGYDDVPLLTDVIDVAEAEPAFGPVGPPAAPADDAAIAPTSEMPAPEAALSDQSPDAFAGSIEPALEMRELHVGPDIDLIDVQAEIARADSMSDKAEKEAEDAMLAAAIDVGPLVGDADLDAVPGVPPEPAGLAVPDVIDAPDAVQAPAVAEATDEQGPSAPPSTDLGAHAAAMAQALAPQVAPPAVQARLAEDDPRWDTLAEEVRMQVLQRIDLFTETGLQDELRKHLQPIVDRASAELVVTIQREIGQVLRAYVAQAIEREIDRWRRDTH